jgi:glycine betaine transporter
MRHVTVLRAILSVAIVATLLTSALILLRYGRRRVQGAMPLSLLGFSSVLFTSGLDVGLVMFPLTEFPVYAREPEYAFTNPLAVTFAFWGFLVWAFYFLTTFYFVAIEPHVRIFELRWVKFVHNVVIIGTTAFTAHLLLRNLPFYAPALDGPARHGLVGATILLAVISSTRLTYVRHLSIGSMWIFGGLILVMWLQSGMGIGGFAASARDLSDYFVNLRRFVLPLSDYHAFYLFWWFSWSLMIGQFVARFVGAMRTWQLAAALLVIPSIPLAAWFSVLWFFYREQRTIPDFLNVAMVAVGVLFVVNSLDSLIRLYAENLGLTSGRLGVLGYVVMHAVLMYALVLAFQFATLRIEWIGLVVIALYAAVFVLLARRREALRSAAFVPERHHERANG